MKPSKTMVAAIASVVSGVFMIAGSPLDQGTLTALTDSINGAVGSVMVAYGVVMGILRKFTSTPLAGWFNKE